MGLDQQAVLWRPPWSLPEDLECLQLLLARRNELGALVQHIKHHAAGRPEHDRPGRGINQRVQVRAVHPLGLFHPNRAEAGRGDSLALDASLAAMLRDDPDYRVIKVMALSGSHLVLWQYRAMPQLLSAIIIGTTFILLSQLMMETYHLPGRDHAVLR